MQKQVIFLIFILILFYIIRNNNNAIESFRNRRRKRNNKNNTQNNKEDFSNMSIATLFKTVTGSSEKRQKFINEVNERERNRHELIMNKPSKNTKDSMKKFNALKDGFYDIINLNMVRQ